MKKILSLFGVIIVLIFSLSGCTFTDIDKNRDSNGYVQFIAEFNKGLFAFTHKSDSKQRYYPENSVLEKNFVFGSYDVKFTAEYSDESIVYTVKDVSDDRISEIKTFFNDIYPIYYDSWSNYVNKAGVGTVTSDNSSDVKTLELIIGGELYSVAFDPYAETPNITYQISAIA